MTTFCGAGAVTSIDRSIQMIICQYVDYDLIKKVGIDEFRSVIQRVPVRIFDMPSQHFTRMQQHEHYHELARIIGSIIIPRIFAKEDDFILSPTDEIMGLQFDTVKSYMIKDSQYSVRHLPSFYARCA